MNKQEEKPEQAENGHFNIFEEAPKQKPVTQIKLKPQPLVEPKLQKKICELIQQLLVYKQIKKGVNEVMKVLHKGGAEAIILAADCDPIEIIMTLPPICEEKNVPYCFVSSKANLGRACGIKRPVVAICITFQEGASLQSQILELKDTIEQLYV